MFSQEEFQFAAKYPFSSVARDIVKYYVDDFSKVSLETKDLAKGIILDSYFRTFLSPYDIKVYSKELLLDHILAYPLAKIYVSIIANEELYTRFAKYIAKRTYDNLTNNNFSEVFDLAYDLNIEFSTKNDFVVIPLFSFLKVDCFDNDNSFKLVNQRLDAGNVYLSREKFAKFLSNHIFSELLNTLPCSVDGLPSSLKEEANSIRNDIFSRKYKISFNKIQNIYPNAFPACYRELYFSLLSGSNLTHIARFYLAVFLAAVGMKKESIIELFKNAPNYNETKTKYHVDRIFSKKRFLPPSCAKLREYGLCKDNCNVKNPIVYYKKMLFTDKKQK
ncbi:MAG: hypothetical protein N3D73_01090 [Candidatus Diapherotrites archaeon]|nr:hypothetical protein [Candidatus Diapherotrites archaeon]